ALNLYSQVNVKGYYRSNGTYVQPHQRTSPNSTITDNYSYPGNYNPNVSYDNSASQTNYNGASQSSSNEGNEWVEGYFRSDGTYIKGYYIKKIREPKNYNGSSDKKYINTSQVNVRTTPEVAGNIINRLNYGDEITSLYISGEWEKVRVKKYNIKTYNYENYEGYINRRYLSISVSNKTVAYPSNSSIYSTGGNSDYDLPYKVTSQRAYFYSTPSVNSQNKTYLVYGELITAIGDSKYFIYVEFVNSNGIKTIGWILKSDITRY
ncbi:SH3 domain-containing protein, partial [Flavobacterium bizetiae]|uniref:SH3 domain-containing protein n=1 Tax=Flavobacterium bizetiae TaxID=2704140 RepID=UPI001E32C27A